MTVIKFLAFGDSHCPLLDYDAHRKLLDTIKDFRPDVLVHLGDGHESDAASRFPSEKDWDLLSEFESHNEFLASIREVSPDSEKVFIYGNHDQNILAQHRIPPKLRTLCNFHDHEPELKYWNLPTKYVYDANRCTYRIGQVTFYHGFEHSVSADEYQAYILGLPYGLSISGHTHQPKEVTQCRRTKSVPLPYWYANAGCLTEFDRDYMERKRQYGWGHACIIGEATVKERPSASYYYQPNWDAELVTFKMYGD